MTELLLGYIRAPSHGLHTTEKMFNILCKLKIKKRNKKLAVIYLKVLSKNFIGGTGRKHEKLGREADVRAET
jgi:hypothetical protein